MTTHCRPGRPKGRKSMFPNDTQRERLYKAEHQLDSFDSKDFDNPAEVEEYILSIIKKGWFRKRYTIRGLWLRTSNRRYDRARGDRYRTYANLYLPRWAWSKQVILHELAHACTPPLLNDEFAHLSPKTPYPGGRAAHGPEFVSTYLHLVENECPEILDELKRSFREHDVDWRSYS